MELWNSVKFKDLDQKFPVRIHEESPPEDAIPSLERYQVNKSLVCSRMYEGPHVLLPFVSTKDPFGCLVINLEGTVQVTESNIGLITEPIRELLSSGSSRSMWCGEHFKSIDHSAVVLRLSDGMIPRR